MSLTVYIIVFIGKMKQKKEICVVSIGQNETRRIHGFYWSNKRNEIYYSYWSKLNKRKIAWLVLLNTRQKKEKFHGHVSPESENKIEKTAFRFKL